MSIFDIGVALVLEREGGLVDHPDDPGGKTNYGISQVWADRAGLEVDVGTLLRQDAVEIYRLYFWEPYAFSSWPEKDAELAVKVFDASVHLGPARAMRALQRALRSCGQAYVLDDGVYGPVTARAKDVVPLDKLLPAYRSELAGIYRQCVAEEPRKQVFLKGWLRRAYDELGRGDS